ncbi:phosphodiester glycosidase family protein, partial [Streptomyces sp. T-3]|nr:phosphodiester glycosidase family protein [Streptomyces sp. T-3]
MRTAAVRPRRPGHRTTAGLALLLLLAACTPTAPHDTGPADDGRDGGRTDAARPARLPDGVAFKQSTRTLGDGQPVRIHVLSIGPRAAADVTGIHGRTLKGAATVRVLAGSAGAVAAVNGSFFDIPTGGHFGGHAGDPLGVYGTGGRLLSEASNGRTALILGGPGTRPRITEVRTATTVESSDGSRATVDGINRKPGRILGCGGVGGDRLAGTDRTVTAPLHGQLCVDSSEIVDFRPQWGPNSPPGTRGSTEAVLDARGRVTALRSPAGGP